MILNGIRLGFFAYMEDTGRLHKVNGKLDIAQHLMVTSTGASLGTLVSNPLYIVKCLQQGEIARRILEGERPRVKRQQATGTFGTIKDILHSQGVFGAYKGALPAMLISAYGSSIQLVTFQVSKCELEKRSWNPTGQYASSLGSAAVSGLVLTVTMLPLDVVVSRYIIQPRDRKGNGTLYQNYREVCGAVFRQEGLQAFFRGFPLSYLKNGPHTLITLFTWDFIRALEK